MGAWCAGRHTIAPARDGLPYLSSIPGHATSPHRLTLPDEPGALRRNQRCPNHPMPILRPATNWARVDDREDAGAVARRCPQCYGPASIQPALRVRRMGMIYIEDLRVGDSWESSEHLVDGAEMLAYNKQNDPWPMDVDPDAAAKTPFGGVIASGGYTISLMYRLGHEIYNRADHQWAFLGGFDWHLKFVEPVRAGDRLRERITILETRLSSKPGRGISKIRMELLSDRDRVVLSVESTGLMATRPI